MSTSPDAQVIYDQAIALEERVRAFKIRAHEFYRADRDLQLELLSNGFLPDAPAEVRLRACAFRANQLLEERDPELFAWLDEELASIEAMQARNEAVVAAGWAESFSLNRWSRSLTDQTRKDIEG